MLPEVAAGFLAVEYKALLLISRNDCNAMFRVGW